MILSPLDHRYRVLAISQDRPLLRHLACFLSSFGYVVEQAVGFEQGRLALESAAHDFVIVDDDVVFEKQGVAAGGPGGQDDFSPLESLFQSDQGPSPEDPESAVHVFLLANFSRPVDNGNLRDPKRCAAAIQAGVNDFLSKPLNYGEALARLRAGARSLEFERRARRLEGAGGAVNMENEFDFHLRVRRKLASRSRQEYDAPPAWSCLLLELDFYSRFSRRFGRSAAQLVLGAAAEKLKQLAEENPAWTIEWRHFGDGRFAALVGASEAETWEWAEHVRQVFAETDFRPLDGQSEPGPLGRQRPCPTVRLTISGGVAGESVENVNSPKISAGQLSHDLLRAAQEALTNAIRSGRDCVVRTGQFDGETHLWNSASTGSVFLNTTARQLMTPCTIVLHDQDSAAQGAALLERTHLQIIPIVDGSGKLTGAITNETDWPDEGIQAATPLCQVMMVDPPHCEEETAFPELLEFFTQDDRPLIITRGRRPMGIVTGDDLAVLAEPAIKHPLAPLGPIETASQYLFAPAVAELDAG